MLDSGEPGPVNLGNPDERTVDELAHLVIEVTGTSSGIGRLPLPVDDPTRRCPVIDRAREHLGWSPEITLREGLRHTVEWFRTLPPQDRGAAGERGDRVPTGLREPVRR
jgi:dTDP-glucose 4,6-dehydratase